jgi:sugar phosphate isomerase/epimerase
VGERVGGRPGSADRFGRAVQSRRVVLGGAGAIAAASFSGRLLAIDKPPPLSRRPGVQLYMLGKLSIDELPAQLKALREIGYREVETSPLPGASAETLRAELDRAGLACASCHIGLEALAPGMLSLAEPAPAIAYAKTLGAEHVVVALFPFMSALKRRPDAQAVLSDLTRLGPAISDIARSMTPEDWLDVARRLNEAGAKLAAGGLRVGYHNHNVEFVRLANGQSAFDLLVARTDPKLVDFELDLGWVAAAGIEPAGLLKRLGARVAQLHLKDLAATPANTTLKINSADLGAGVQDWPAILDAVRASSVRHAYVEQEPPYAPSGLEAARRAYAFIQPSLAKKGL